MTQTHLFREAWLTAAVEALTPLFTEHGYTIPDGVRVSVGFPGGRGPKANVVGQCWASASSADKRPQIFVHPVLDEPVEILGVLAHELAHAADDCASGHKGPFTKIIRAIGLEGKPTHAITFNDDVDLTDIVTGLGEYPHGRLGGKGTDEEEGEEEKRPGSRMLKVICADADPEDREAYKVRMTRKMIDEVGLPICPCHHEQMSEAEAA